MDTKAIERSIREKLCEIEQKEDVRVLYCAESGSRAWGFASPDSDFDARFIYVRKPEYYLRLGKTRDVIEWQLDDVYDVNGWDLQKALRLLYGSNPTLFEWNASPIVYRTSGDWEKVSALMPRYFDASGAVKHYLGMAKNNHHAYLRGELVKLKKYFYVLRPILAARWILDRGTPPPVPFEELKAAELDSAIIPTVDELVKRKTSVTEMGKAEHIPQLDEYISSSLEELSTRAAQMERTVPKDRQPLDDIFLELLGMR